MKSLIFILSFFVSQSLWAQWFTWSGQYHIDYLSLSDPALNNSISSKNYFFHQLSLRPKIIVLDGLDIFAQFDIFNCEQVGCEGFNQAGGPFGGEVPNFFKETDSSAQVEVHELYLRYQQEFGSFFIGRVPLDFGLGAVYNSGKEFGTQWTDALDMISYKINIGAYFFQPYWGQDFEKEFSINDDIKRYGFIFHWEKAYEGLSMGLFYQDVSGSGVLFPQIGTDTYSVDTKFYNFMAKKKEGQRQWGIEFGFQSGDISNASQSFNLDGVGVAVEMDWFQSQRDYKLKLGFVTGDDLDTDGVYEGYLFNRNYDLGLILFNHLLGDQDIVGTGYDDEAFKKHNALDIGAITNAIYLSGEVLHRHSKNLSFTGQLITAQSQVSKKNLGYELDLGMVYKPRPHFRWVNKLAYLIPGKAFKDEDLSEKSFAFYSQFSWSF